MLMFFTEAANNPLVLYLFMFALLSFAGAAYMLRSWTFSILQLLLIVGIIYNGGLTWLIYLLGMIQIVIAVWFLFKIKQAIDFNYRLILEKTHQIKPGITKGGKSGVQKSFL